MRGGAEIDAKSSKIDDQKFQNSPGTEAFPHLGYRSLVLLNDSMLKTGKTLHALKSTQTPV
jgi:hypothetical protein